MQTVLTVLPIFLLIALGWTLRQRGFFSLQTLKENNSLLYYFAMPSLLLRGILGARAVSLILESSPWPSVPPI